MNPWIEKSIDLKANVEYVLRLESPANVVLVRNHTAAENIYLSNNRVTTSIYDSVAMPGSWGSVAQPSNLKEIHLISNNDIAGVKVIMLLTDAPGTFMGQMMKAPIGVVSVNSTVALKASELHLDGDKDLQVDVLTMPDIAIKGFTWMKVTAAEAGDVTVKAAAGQVLALVANASESIYLKDGASQAWKTGDFTLNHPLICLTSIKVNFAGAGDAWILYR